MYQIDLKKKKTTTKNKKENVQKEPQAQNIAFKWQ